MGDRRGDMEKERGICRWRWESGEKMDGEGEGRVGRRRGRVGRDGGRETEKSVELGEM